MAQHTPNMVAETKIGTGYHRTPKTTEARKDLAQETIAIKPKASFSMTKQKPDDNDLFSRYLVPSKCSINLVASLT